MTTEHHNHHFTRPRKRLFFSQMLLCRLSYPAFVDPAGSFLAGNLRGLHVIKKLKSEKRDLQRVTVKCTYLS